MPGIDPDGTRDKLVVREGDVVRRYTLMVEDFDVAELEAQIAELEAMTEPTLAELREFVKGYHPYYQRTKLLARLHAERERIEAIG